MNLSKLIVGILIFPRGPRNNKKNDKNQIWTVIWRSNGIRPHLQGLQIHSHARLWRGLNSQHQGQQPYKLNRVVSTNPISYSDWHLKITHSPKHNIFLPSKKKGLTSFRHSLEKGLLKQLKNMLKVKEKYNMGTCTNLKRAFRCPISRSAPHMHKSFPPFETPSIPMSLSLTHTLVHTSLAHSHHLLLNEILGVHSSVAR